MQSRCFCWLTRVVFSPLLGEPLKYTRLSNPAAPRQLIRPARHRPAIGPGICPGYTWEMTHLSQHLLGRYVAIHHPDARLTSSASLNIQVSDRPVRWRRPDRSASRTGPDILPV
jgi:hypothetical protein